MYSSWQDCCRRGENRSWPSVSVESVDSEYWCLKNAIVYAFIMRLTVEERVLRPTFKLNTLCIYIYIIYYIKINYMFRPLTMAIFRYRLKNLVSSYTRLIWAVYSVEVRGEVGTRSNMCYVGWVVWVHGVLLLYVMSRYYIMFIEIICIYIHFTYKYAVCNLI